MRISDIYSSVTDILERYYTDTDINTTSSVLIIGGNTININILNNEKSNITTTQLNKLIAAAVIVGKYCLLLDYSTAYRIYLAVLMGLSTKSGATPLHYGATYASNIFGDVNIGNVTVNTSDETIDLTSTEFTTMSLSGIQSYVKDLLSEYTDNSSDYGYDEIVFKSSSSDTSENTITIPMRLYHALICRYLIKYVNTYGESKVAFVVIYSIKVAINLISSNSMIDITITDNKNSTITLAQLSDIDSETSFGIDELDIEIDGHNKIAILISIIVCVFIASIFTSLTAYVIIKSIKRVKEINFKIK